MDVGEREPENEEKRVKNFFMTFGRLVEERRRLFEIGVLLQI